MHSTQSPLEVFRFCPKCGHNEISYETEKSLRCSKCDFRYFINMSASVAAIIRNNKNEILFTLRRHAPAAGMLDLPGGFVDLGETAEEAIKREIKEELNLEITSMQFFGTFANKYLFEEIEYQTLDLVFNCNVLSFDQLRVADDVSGYIFREPESVNPSEIGLDSIRLIIKTINQ